MPRHKMHEFVGIALWIIFLVYVLLNYSFAPLRLAIVAITAFVLCFIGSILPDVDSKHSRAFKKLRFIVALVVFVVAFISLYPRAGQDFVRIVTMLGISALLAIAVVIFLYAFMPAHRGPVHSLRVGAIYGVVALIAAYVVLLDLQLALIIAFFAFLSFVAHLVLDKVK